MPCRGTRRHASWPFAELSVAKSSASHHSRATIDSPAEELIEAQIQFGDLGAQFDGPEDTAVGYSIFLNDPDGHHNLLRGTEKPDSRDAGKLGRTLKAGPPKAAPPNR